MAVSEAAKVVARMAVALAVVERVAVGLAVAERAAARRRRMKWRYCIEILYRGRWKGRERPRKGKSPLGAGVQVQIDEHAASCGRCYTCRCFSSISAVSMYIAAQNVTPRREDQKSTVCLCKSCRSMAPLPEAAACTCGDASGTNTASVYSCSASQTDVRHARSTFSRKA